MEKERDAMKKIRKRTDNLFAIYANPSISFLADLATFIKPSQQKKQ